MKPEDEEEVLGEYYSPGKYISPGGFDDSFGCCATE